MYFLAGFVFLLAFTAFASGETCSQVMNCLKFAEEVQTTAAAGNMGALCPILKNMVDCFSSALADCQSAGSSYPQETLNQFQTAMSDARKRYENLCTGGSEGNTGGGDGSMTYNAGSGGSVPETVSCMEAGKCVFDVVEMQNAVTENRLGEACAMITASSKCLKSAVNDCKTNNLLPEDQLQGMSEQVTQIEALHGQHCKDGMSVSVGTGSGTAVDSSQNVACSDVVSCTPDSEKLVEAITNGRHDDACDMLKRSYSCLKSAVEDCKAKNLVTGSDLESMENSYKSYEPQMNQYCQSPTGGVHCMDSITCTPDTDALTDALTNSRFQEACRILTTSTTCLDSAVQDCKARGVMSEEDIKSMEEMKKSYEPQMQQMCHGDAKGGVSCFQMQTCSPDEAATARMNKSLENQQYEEACNIMKPALECQKSAVEDCRRRGALDATSLKQVEEGVAFAEVQMKKYCSSGNSASMSMLHIFTTTLLVFVINFVTSRM